MVIFLRFLQYLDYAGWIEFVETQQPIYSDLVKLFYSSIMIMFSGKKTDIIVGFMFKKTIMLIGGT